MAMVKRTLSRKAMPLVGLAWEVRVTMVLLNLLIYSQNLRMHSFFIGEEAGFWHSNKSSIVS